MRNKKPQRVPIAPLLVKNKGIRWVTGKKFKFGWTTQQVVRIAQGKGRARYYNIEQDSHISDYNDTDN